MCRSVPGTGGGVRRVRRRSTTLEALGCPRSPRPLSPTLDATGASGETQTAVMKNAAPVMDAACKDSIARSYLIIANSQASASQS